MPRYFTHYWRNDTWDYECSQGLEGQPLEHAGSNLFRTRGVSSGDFVYVVTVRKGTLYLLARMHVKGLCDYEEAVDKFGDDVWDATDHVIASSSTPMRFEERVPLGITQDLEFISGAQVKRLKFSDPGCVDQQTLRGVRELTARSARALDALIAIREQE
jgi:hypothetical protein